MMIQIQLFHELWETDEQEHQTMLDTIPDSEPQMTQDQMLDDLIRHFGFEDSDVIYFASKMYDHDDDLMYDLYKVLMNGLA